MWKLNTDASGITDAANDTARSGDIVTASWATEGRSWTLAIAGGDRGIALTATDDDDDAVRFLPVGQDRLPTLAEAFIRGDQLHLNYPQADQAYSLHLVFQPVVVSADRLVLQTVVSIETTRLDGAPSIDLVAPGDGLLCLNPEAGGGGGAGAGGGVGVGVGVGGDNSGDADSGFGGSAAITAVARGRFAAAILQGPRDYPWTHDLSDDRELRLRLFGEFLEKGVIRKAMPWIVLDRSGDLPGRDELVRWARELAAADLPLMA